MWGMSAQLSSADLYLSWYCPCFQRGQADVQVALPHVNTFCSLDIPACVSSDAAASSCSW
jgi:hypothetical protein